MTAPKGYFDRTPKIRTEGEMLAKLKERSTPHQTLQWLAPVKATQRTADGKYEVRAAKSGEQYVYWAWALLCGPRPKLVGHSPDPDLARNHCEAHAKGTS